MTRALVVYESMWGSTELLARAVAEGVGEYMPVDLTDVAAASLDLDEVTLVVVGGPTHGHGMSSPESRRVVRCLGAPHGSICTGLREWLGELPEERNRWIAAFDTKVSGAGRLPGSAAEDVAREGRRHHFLTAARPRTFYLLDDDGPLLEGEIDQAREWGRLVASSVPTPGDYDPPLGQLVERVRAVRARVDSDRPVLVGVVGEPGAGKSTLTASLVAALREGGTSAVLVPMDGFHLANVALAALGRADRKGAIDTFDGAGYAALLARLLSAGPDTVWAPTYDRSLEESVANAIAVPPRTDVVVTEGNYLLVDEGPWSAVRGLLDEAWAVEVDPQLRTERLVARHVEFGKSPEVAAAWVASVDDPNAAFVRATFIRADLVIGGR